ncbi:MAG: hypothetical protein PHP95_07585 [Desulfuromonadaceae bacterium]|nr:hypothetical protein [Desulfuromonadaceae bacterium]MDD2848301.1 hypothetical protein [Desulfuromonadaceae bacterium]MDD4129303.1 hypothetical protein [Desulfuromonadaceae bacterium]
MNSRTEYVERLSAQLVEWDRQIEQLKDKVASSTPEIPVDHANAIAALKIKRDEAAEKLQGISTAGDHEWEELKSGTDDVWGEVRSILHDAIMKIK